MKVLVTVILSSVCALFVGCAHFRSNDELAHFRKRDANEATRYHFITPVSPEFLEYVGDYHKTTVDSLLRGVELRKDKPEELARYIEKFKRIDWASEFDWVNNKIARELKRGGQLYLFKYSKPGYNDYGVLVLRGGRIVCRDTFGEMRIGDVQ